MTHRETLLGKVMLTMLVALPLSIITNTEIALQGSSLSEPAEMTSVRKTARSYRETLTQEARINAAWREKCRAKVMADPSFICPSFYDRNAVRLFLKGEETTESGPHAAAGSGMVVLSIQNLDEKDQALLRRYMNARSCPSTLKSYSVKGFYELCLRMITGNSSRDERMGVGEKVQNRFKLYKSAAEQRREMRKNAR